MKGKVISASDRGFLYGDGIFETMRAYGGCVFKLRQHLSRLFGASAVVKIRIPCSRQALENLIYGAIKTNRLKDAYVRVTVTRGEGAFTMVKGREPKANIVISAKGFKGYPAAFYSRGISAKVSDIRQNECSPLSGIKSLNYLEHILARMRVQDEGFDEVILMNTKGHIAEAATSNIFLVKAGRVITPSLDSGILPGITRSVIIKIAKRLGIRVTERAVLPKELAKADEVFLTNSLAEVLPVTKIGPKRIGSSLPGDLTRLLHTSYLQEINKF